MASVGFVGFVGFEGLVPFDPRFPAFQEPRRAPPPSMKLQTNSCRSASPFLPRLLCLVTFAYL